MIRSSMSPRILMFGIGGVYNYGCEAIVRGTERLIHERWPSAEIIYASPRPEDDRRRLEGLPIEIVCRRQLPRYSIRNVCRKLAEVARVPWQPNFYDTGVLKGIDAVFSIGGDLLTPGRSGGYPKSLVAFGESVLKRGKPYVLWGASVGPFDRNPVVERVIQQHLKRLTLTTAREAETLAYLRQLGITENVVACADPAFVVAPEIQRQRNEDERSSLRLAINLSPLSVGHLQIDRNDAIRQQAECITTFVESLGCEILLIPHVVCHFNEDDDDLRYLARIRQALPPSIRRHAELLDTDPGFLGVKRELIRCGAVIAARMHCAVNALAASVPTILLTYSQKAIGMSQYVYGTNDWAVSIRDFTGERMLHVVQELFGLRSSISILLRERMAQVGRDARTPMQELEKVCGWQDGGHQRAHFTLQIARSSVMTKNAL